MRLAPQAEVQEDSLARGLGLRGPRRKAMGSHRCSVSCLPPAGRRPTGMSPRRIAGSGAVRPPTTGGRRRAPSPRSALVWRLGPLGAGTRSTPTGGLLTPVLSEVLDVTGQGSEIGDVGILGGGGVPDDDERRPGAVDRYVERVVRLLEESVPATSPASATPPDASAFLATSRKSHCS